jgi:18S rRNA (guanine1575-N7)-methyltransferase
VLQWLLNAETSHPTSSPPHRLTRFFTTLHSALRNPSRAVLQFYPQTDDQIQLITSIARKAGFGGGVVVDYPNSNKAKKVFLCLYVGGNAGMQQVPKGLEGDNQESDAERIKFERRRQREQRRERSGKRKTVKDKEWILKKKEVGYSICLADPLIHIASCSCIASGERRGYREIPSSQAGGGSRLFDIDE